MKKILLLFLALMGGSAYAQSINADHLNPTNTSASAYRFLKLGSSTDAFGGILLNVSSATYGNGNDLTFFTYDNRDMNFRTGTGNFIVFPSSGGKVGIGTTTPQARLTVSHSGTMGGLYMPDKAFLSLTNGAGTLLLDNNEIYSSEMLILGSSYSHDIEFRNVNAQSKETLMSVKSSGNVGIGTTSPNEKLQVNGNIRLNDYSIKSAGNSRIDFGNTGLGNENDDIGVYIHDDGEFEMYKNGTRMMNVAGHFNIALADNVNVGVGTTTPSHKLSVNGTIRAKEILVEASPWPDYVFGKSYDLMSLDDVSAYIQKEGHLPNIPSAKEIENSGLPLGEMNTKLMEKIEELTLYTLEQEQKIKKLESRNELIDALLKRIEALESN